MKVYKTFRSKSFIIQEPTSEGKSSFLQLNLTNQRFLISLGYKLNKSNEYPRIKRTNLGGR